MVAGGVDLQLARVEHLFKSSLAVISGWASTLDDRWDELSEEQRRHAVAVIRRRSDQLADHTQRLLAEHAVDIDLTRAPVAVDLLPVLEDVAKWGTVPTSGRPFAIAIDDGVVARADADAIWQILTLLVENAIKYSPAGGAIELGARRTGDRVEIWVTDEGIGLPEGYDLFAARERGGREAGLVSGAGLGLYICGSLVAAMGGTIEARANDDVGATFVVSLPAA